MKSDVRTAVVGCGSWGKNLVRNFATVSQLKVCCDESRSTLGRIADQYPGVRTTSSYAEVLAAPDVDAVILATPAPSHASMAIAALNSGKHVFVEKPMALSVEEAEQIAEAAAHSDGILMVGHLLEYHPAVTHIRGMIERGELGDLYYCYSQRLNLGRIRPDENALWSLAPHDISVTLYLLGEEPDTVEAQGQAFLQPGIEDTVFVNLGFPSGRLAHVHVSWLDPHKIRTLTVVGSEKMVVFDDMQAQERVRVYDKGVARKFANGSSDGTLNYAEMLVLREGDIVIPALPVDEPLSLECREFVDCVKTGRRPRSDLRDGMRVVRVLERAQRSLEAHRLEFAGASL